MSTSTRFHTENEMVELAQRTLASLGVPAYVSVPCFSRCIDLVLLEENRLVAVEFKLHDWRRGLIQAEHHLIAVDFSYVCLPVREVTPKMEKMFNESDVGLLMLDVEYFQLFKVVFPAKPSRRKWSIGEQWLRKALETGVMK